MEITNYVIDQALVLIPVLYVVGMFLKSSLIPDRFIPITILTLGAVLAVFLMGFNVNAVIQGILVSGCAVFVNQLLKQSKE